MLRKVLIALVLSLAHPVAGRGRRHHRHGEGPRRRCRRDRQHADPARRHRRARGRPALPQHQEPSAGPAASPRATSSPNTPRARAGSATPASIDRRGRTVARCEVGGEDIQKWLVRSGWALAYTRISKDYEPRRGGRARGKSRDVAGRLHRALGLACAQQEDRRSWAPPSRPTGAHAVLLASASGPVAPSPGLHHQGQRQQRRRVHLPQADQPLVHPDQDEDQQGHPLVLLDRRGGSRRLPRDQAVSRIAPDLRFACFS